MFARRRTLLHFALLLAGLCAACGSVQAATLQLEPVSIRLTPSSRAAVMRLRNGGNRPMNVQVRAFRWTQAGGEDRLHATEALRISPPIQAISPGAEQHVRVLLAEEFSAQSEETFRLVVDELPGAPAADGQVRMLIRYSVPVTVQPPGLTPPELQFQLHQAPDGAVLEAHNHGGRSARLADLKLTTASGETIEINRGLFGYVLAGQTRRWPLAPRTGKRFGQATGVTAQVDGKAGSFPFEVAR